MSDEEPFFYGHSSRECGDHRTVGSHRAWCFECGEWCYPNIPCKGCELPALRNKVAALELENAALRAVTQSATSENQA